MKKVLTGKYWVLLLILTTGCYHDDEETLMPCRTTAADLQYTRVAQLLAGYGCTGCHSGTAPQGGIQLQNYGSVKAVVDAGKLWGAISHAAGFSPMPKNAAKMNACDLDLIKAWIAAGAPEQ